MVIETHHSIISTFNEYFDKRKLNVSSIRDHFTTVYHLLDEMVDGGFPFTMEMNQLKATIKVYIYATLMTCNACVCARLTRS